MWEKCWQNLYWKYIVLDQTFQLANLTLIYTNPISSLQTSEVTNPVCFVNKTVLSWVICFMISKASDTEGRQRWTLKRSKIWTKLHNQSTVLLMMVILPGHWPEGDHHSHSPTSIRMSHSVGKRWRMKFPLLRLSSKGSKTRTNLVHLGYDIQLSFQAQAGRNHHSQSAKFCFWSLTSIRKSLAARREWNNCHHCCLNSISP